MKRYEENKGNDIACLVCDYLALLCSISTDIFAESIVPPPFYTGGLDYSLFAVFFIIIDWQTIMMSNNVKSSN